MIEVKREELVQCRDQVKRLDSTLSAGHFSECRHCGASPRPDVHLNGLHRDNVAFLELLQHAAEQPFPLTSSVSLDVRYGLSEMGPRLAFALAEAQGARLATNAPEYVAELQSTVEAVHRFASALSMDLG